ncbi:hypothetical protein ACFTWS_39635 [Streptomyces sp. NPDC057027]|uniref:hypothetical protein n=1 Tax=Streptomyces sp. NPDC057027 TaxID=3346004 RepID=UPI00362AF15F
MRDHPPIKPHRPTATLLTHRHTTPPSTSQPKTHPGGPRGRSPGRALKAKGVPAPEIARKLVIKTGKNAGKNPSVASVYRALADAEETTAGGQAGQDEDGPQPQRPVLVGLHRPGEPLTAEDIELRERLVAQRAALTAADREEATL